TFTNLRDVINTLQGSFINAVINTTAKTVTVTALVSGALGDLTVFDKSSSAFTLNPSSGFLTGGGGSSVTVGNIPISISDLNTTYHGLTTAINFYVSNLVTASINSATQVITIISSLKGLAGNSIKFSASVPDGAYVLSPLGGFLSGATAFHAGGTLDYTANPSEGEIIVIDGDTFEFDTDNSGIVAGSILVPISGIGITYSGLMNAINTAGQAVATLDVVQKHMDL